MSKETATLRFRMKAPRWAKVIDFLKREALFYDLESSFEVSKGWVTEEFVAVFKGDLNNIDMFEKSISRTINNWNQ